MKTLLTALVVLSASLTAQLPETGQMISLDGLSGVNGVLLNASGQVYASDPSLGFVNAYDASGLQTQQLSGVQDSRVPVMAGMDFDAKGRLLVAQKDPCQVVIFDKSGAVVMTLGNKPVDMSGFNVASSPWLDQPTDLSIAADGRIYVADTGHHRIAVYDGSTGAFIKAWGKLGYSGSDALSEPRGISVSHNRVYVADSGNARVMVYDLDGNFIRQVGQRGISAEGLDSPFDVAVDGAGNLWVADNGLQKIVVYGPDDAVLKVYGGMSATMSFEDLTSLYAGESGVVVAGDGYASRVFTFATGVAYSRGFETVKPAVAGRLADARLAFGPVPVRAGQALQMQLPLQADRIAWDVLSLDMRRVGGGDERNSSTVAMADTRDLASGVYLIRTRVEAQGEVRQEFQKIIVTR